MAFERFWPDNLEQGEADTPAPKAGELLVKVGAVSLNFRDKAIVDGIYEPHKVPKPLIPVSDAAGTVVATGKGVSRKHPAYCCVNGVVCAGGFWAGAA